MRMTKTIDRAVKLAPKGSTLAGCLSSYAGLPSGRYGLVNLDAETRDLDTSEAVTEEIDLSVVFAETAISPKPAPKSDRARRAFRKRLYDGAANPLVKHNCKASRC